MRHYEYYKKLYRLISSILLVVLLTGGFIEVWARKYNSMIVFPYYFKGFLMMAVMYAVLTAFFSWLFKGGQVGYLRRRNTLLTNALSVLCTNLLFYLVTCLLSTFLVPVWSFVLLSAGDIIVLTIITAALNAGYEKIFPDMKLLLICSEVKYVPEVKVMTQSWNGKYKIQGVMAVSEGVNRCIAAISDYDGVVICDIQKEERNVIAQYCQDKEIPTYFTARISDILFSNAEGLRFFEGREGRWAFGRELSAAQRFSLIGYLRKVFKGDQTLLYEKINQDIDEGNKRLIVTANPETMMSALESPEYDAILLSPQTLVIPDGIGLIKALELAGYGEYERIPGIEFAWLLLKLADVKGLSLYLYGASEQVIEAMRAIIERDYPNATLLGAVNGYDRDSDEVMNEVAQLSPDIVMVALGVPAQEKLIARHLDSFDKGIFVGVGGSFDVLSGTKKRAPQLFIRLNLEWLYRITTEPKRLSRFFHSNVRFIWEVLRIKRIR